MTAPCERHRPGPAARAAARLGGRLPVLDPRRLQLRAPRYLIEGDRSSGTLLEVG